MDMSSSDSQFHVLAVDDSLIDRKLIEKLLKTSSYQVTTVDSGTKALEFLGWHEGHGRCNNNHSSDETLVSNSNDDHHHHLVEVNLVITDYCMPGMTGYDLLKKIKESSNLRNIPVVIMSSDNVPSRISRCLEGGAEEFFLKPVTPSDVNKLKPHMMKTKFKTGQVQKPENMENQESPTQGDEVNATETSEKQSQSQQQQKEQPCNITSNNNNKRKSAEDQGLSPERSRPRYNNGLTVMSN